MLKPWLRVLPLVLLIWSDAVAAQRQEIAASERANPVSQSLRQSIQQTGVNWPSFRGAQARGVSHDVRVPTEWSIPTGKNIKWKVPIAGLGHASPVIWGNRIFITTAISGQDNPELKVGLYGNIDPVEDATVHKWQIICLDKRTGEVMWQQTPVEAVPRVKRHTKATHANSTPATDGRYVVTFFGSEGLFCFDMSGKLVWKRDLGPLDSGYFKAPKAQWGFASSPIIQGNRVFIQCDVQRGSFVAAFDLEKGTELWRTDRDEVPTWGTPTVHESQLIVNGYKHIGGYDIGSGKEIWKLVGGGDIPVPTPIVSHGLVFITNAHGSQAPLYAIRLNAKGDITPSGGATSNEHIAWIVSPNGAYMQTPVVSGDHLFSARNNGVVSCYVAQTGERLNQKRLGSGRTGFTASPVVAGGRLYFTSEYGDVFVLKADPVLELLAQNPMDEICMATPAISESALYFRTQGHLVAVAEAKQ